MTNQYKDQYEKLASYTSVSLMANVLLPEVIFRDKMVEESSVQSEGMNGNFVPKSQEFFVEVSYAGRN